MSHHFSRRDISVRLVTVAVLASVPVLLGGGASLLWAAPLLLLASLTLSWGAEAAQFFIAQGLALAIVAWLQTLPEFTIEAVLAWRGQVGLLLAGLTGAIRLLVGLGWPLLYFVAAFFAARRAINSKPFVLRLRTHHSIEIIGLGLALIYAAVIGVKRSLTSIDAIVLFALYAGYFSILHRLPVRDAEDADELPAVAAYIYRSPRSRRRWLLLLVFGIAGWLLYITPAPFLDGLLAISAAVGIPQFVLVQWLAPLVSEFPEELSAFYWARREEEAPMALMTLVSSNINQWTVLAGMLPLVFAVSPHSNWLGRIAFDAQQTTEWWLTIAQSFAGLMLLSKMTMRRWEATLLFILWAMQFATSPLRPAIADPVRWTCTFAYAAWALAMLTFGSGTRPVFACLRQLRAELRASGQTRL